MALMPRKNHFTLKEQEFINQWLVKFNIGEKIILDKDEQVVRIKIEKNNNLINVADEGFGVSKLVPLLIKIANISIGSTNPFDDVYRPSILILEEPEIGLHPALQSKLMEMFFDAFQLFNIQIIIETHSEYLIRKLQVMTADSQNKCTSDHSQIYYFYHPNDIPEGESQVFPINIENDGSLSRAFGRGFYDESTNLNIALYNISKINRN
jgi:predicted ATPase